MGDGAELELEVAGERGGDVESEAVEGSGEEAGTRDGDIVAAWLEAGEEVEAIGGGTGGAEEAGGERAGFNEGGGQGGA